MRVIGPDKTYIEYFQGVCSSQLGLSNRFGIRVRDGHCLAIFEDGDGQVNTCSKEFRLPVQLEMLPFHVRMIVNDHVLNYPASDLIDVMTGKTSFQQALDSPLKIGPQRAMANDGEQTSEKARKRR